MSRRKTTEKVKNPKSKKNFKLKYSFLTVVLLICLLEMGVSVGLNVSKSITYKSKIQTSLNLKEKSRKNNESLRYELEHFGSLNTLEAIARNNLKAAREDEVLVIINKKTQPKIKPQDKKSKSLNFSFLN